MKRCFHALFALLVALALLAGCDVSSPSASPSPLPTAGAIPEATATSAPASDATPDNAAYPSPGTEQPPTAFPPGYVPPTPQP